MKRIIISVLLISFWTVLSLGQNKRNDMPNLEIKTLDGKKISARSILQDKPTVVSLWATWCKPCTKEMPAMQTVYNALQEKGFVVVAINELEDIQKVRDHIQEHQHTFAVLLDPDNHVANQYGVVGLPVSIFIDKTGHVRKIVKGGLLTEQSILETVQPLLQETTVSRKFPTIP